MDAWFALPYGPLLIFALRIVDVSLGAVRMIVMVRGYRGMAALTGFLEVIIWIVAIGSALDNLGSIYHVVGYAGGFAAGSYIGVVVEEYLALGQVVVRAIIPDESDGRTARRLREEGYAVTELDGRGRDGPIDVLNTVVNRRDAPRVLDLVEAEASRSFVTVEEIRSTRRGMVGPLTKRTPSVHRR
jgi:uncharacterized protein YebE (UPF0316 family)